MDLLYFVLGAAILFGICIGRIDFALTIICVILIAYYDKWNTERYTRKK